jgi:hypothetical protein
MRRQTGATGAAAGCWHPRLSPHTPHAPLRPQAPSGFDKTGPARAAFVLAALGELRRALRARGSDLLVRLGRPEDVLPQVGRAGGGSRVGAAAAAGRARGGKAQPSTGPRRGQRATHALARSPPPSIQQLAAAAGASRVVCHGEVTAEERGVEAAAARALGALGARLEVVWGGQTLLHPEDLPFAPQATPLSYAEFRQLALGRRRSGGGGSSSRQGADAEPRVRAPLAAPSELAGLPGDSRWGPVGRGSRHDHGPGSTPAERRLQGSPACAAPTPSCPPIPLPQRPADAGRAAIAAAAGLHRSRGAGRGRGSGGDGGAAQGGGAARARRTAGERCRRPGLGGPDRSVELQGDRKTRPIQRRGASCLLPNARALPPPALPCPPPQGLPEAADAAAPAALTASPDLFVQLTPWLALGCVSPRSLYHALLSGAGAPACAADAVANAAADASAGAATGAEAGAADAAAGPARPRPRRQAAAVEAAEARDGGWPLFDLLWRDYFRLVNFRLAHEAPGGARRRGAPALAG